jgi:hypothetical protein
MIKTTKRVIMSQRQHNIRCFYPGTGFRRRPTEGARYPFARPSVVARQHKHNLGRLGELLCLLVKELDKLSILAANKNVFHGLKYTSMFALFIQYGIVGETDCQVLPAFKYPESQLRPSRSTYTNILSHVLLTIPHMRLPVLNDPNVTRDSAMFFLYHSPGSTSIV